MVSSVQQKFKKQQHLFWAMLAIVAVNHLFVFRVLFIYLFEVGISYFIQLDNKYIKSN